jgi:hypothetical protein
MARKKKKETIGKITKLDLIKAPKGHQENTIGTGVHRDKRKQPKGGRTKADNDAINEQ